MIFSNIPIKMIQLDCEWFPSKTRESNSFLPKIILRQFFRHDAINNIIIQQVCTLRIAFFCIRTMEL